MPRWARRLWHKAWNKYPNRSTSILISVSFSSPLTALCVVAAFQGDWTTSGAWLAGTAFVLTVGIVPSLHMDR